MANRFTDMAAARRARIAAAPSGLERLVDAYLELGPNARRILEFIAARLVVGKAHGDFDKPRDYDRETAEEECDGAVYRAAKLLGIGTKGTP